LKPDTRFTVPDHVVPRKLEGELVLLDLSGGSYFGLDALGTRIWEHVEAGEPVEAIVADISGAYDVECETVEQDVRDLLSDLLENGLIAPVEAS